MNCVRGFTSGNFYVLGFLCTNGAAPTKMAAFKYNIALRELLHPSLALRKHGSVFFTSMIIGFLHLGSRSISSGRVIFKASDFGAGKVPARLSLMQQLLQEAEEKAVYANEPTPKITLDHVNVNFARSGGPGGQNVNKVNTKVDMRFNVKGAYWLSDRVRERIMQLEKNRINKDGDIVISSTKTRTQKGNIEDALEKLQAIIDAASYVPPPPSEEQKKKIANLAAIEEQKRLQTKKALSQKKAIRKTRGSWD